MTTTAAMPPPIASARGDAWRGRTPPTPFERTGGGVRTAAAAAWRCCLALLPLGMRRKGSGCLGFHGFACGREDQESDKKEEGGQGERLDLEVAERCVDAREGEPVDGASSRGRLLARHGLGDRP